ncbi:MAG: hypothetical protein IKE01_06550 [Clostridia bacterium]|nr:hypothetical protein [Clostridia bacterium]
MNKEIIKRLIENALKELETVDCESNTKQIHTTNSKKVHKAYDILFNLNQKL